MACQREYIEVLPHSGLNGRTPASISLSSCSPASRPLRAACGDGPRPVWGSGQIGNNRNFRHDLSLGFEPFVIVPGQIVTKRLGTSMIHEIKLNGIDGKTCPADTEVNIVLAFVLVTA
jgi:hypothetical protein